MVKEVKTASGTTFRLTGPTNYVRVARGAEKEHTCLAWGGIAPAGKKDLAGQGLILGVPMQAPGGIALKPVVLRVGEVIPGAPICFLTLENERVVFRLSTPVAEVDGQAVTPEGLAGELPDHLKKLLETDGDESGTRD